MWRTAHQQHPSLNVLTRQELAKLVISDRQPVIADSLSRVKKTTQCTMAWVGHHDRDRYVATHENIGTWTSAKWLYVWSNNINLVRASLCDFYQPSVCMIQLALMLPSKNNKPPTHSVVFVHQPSSHIQKPLYSDPCTPQFHWVWFSVICIQWNHSDLCEWCWRVLNTT